MLEKIFDSILKSFENGNILLAVFIVTFALVVNLKAIVEFLDRQRTKRVLFLTESLQYPGLSVSTRAYIEDALNTELFRRASGIYAEKEFRERLLFVATNSNGEVSISQLNQITRFLSFEKGKVLVRISKGAVTEFWFNRIMGSFVIFFAAATLMLMSSTKSPTIYQFLGLMGMVVLFGTMGIVMYIQTIPLTVAKKIAPAIESIQNKSDLSLQEALGDAARALGP
jgi:hypothetical protein